MNMIIMWKGLVAPHEYNTVTVKPHFKRLMGERVSANALCSVNQNNVKKKEVLQYILYCLHNTAPNKFYSYTCSTVINTKHEGFY